MDRYPYAWVYYANELDIPMTPGWYWTGVYGPGGNFGMDHGPWETEAETVADAKSIGLPIRDPTDIM